MKHVLSLLALFVAGPAFAIPTSQPTASIADEQAAVAPADTSSNLHVSGEFDFTTAYMFRGQLQTENGLIFQPTINIGYDLVKTDTVTITPAVNLWANVTDKKYTSGVDYWDELDVTPSVAIQYGHWTVTPQYLLYYSPANNFGTTHELGINIAYDDSDLFKKLPFSFQPYVGVYQEIENPGGIHQHGTYWEVGVGPTFQVLNFNALSFTIPVKFGGGFNNYFQDSHGGNSYAGYAMAGIVAKYNITDNIYIKSEVDYYQAFAESNKISYGGRDNKVVATIGAGFSF